MKTTLLLIRHGKSKGNLVRKFQGHDDTPLSDVGREQAQLLKEKLMDTMIDVVYRSPLKRAKTTAQIVFEGHKVPFIEEPLLIERNFGVFDGLTLEEAKKIHCNAEDFYMLRLVDLDLKGVESLYSVQNRALATIEKIVKENKGKTVALVTHNFWIKSFLSRILDLPFSEVHKHSVRTTSVTTVFAEDIEGELIFEVKEIGDKTHMKEHKHLDF